MRHIADTEAALKNAPESMRAMLGPVMAPLMSFARQQARLNEDLWMRYDSLPGRHATTHLDGDDSVSSTSDPTAIALTNVADPGTPHSPLSRGDHVHPVGDDIADILELLDGLDADPIFGIPVTDARVRKLLELILLQLYALAGNVVGLLEEDAPVQTIASGPVAIPATTGVVTLLQPNVSRVGFVIVNAGTQNLFVKYGPNATTTDWTYRVTTNATLELPTVSGYQGIVTGTWDTANGTAQVTEISRLGA